MPQVEVLFYQEDDGSSPPLDWLMSLPAEARNRCQARLALLHELGHELRRPHAENLGEGLYELRVKCYRVNYRMLYFFHGREAVVVTQGFTKKRVIPPEEIELAIARMRKFISDNA